MNKQKRTTVDEFSAYLQSAVNTTINYMNDKSKIKDMRLLQKRIWKMQKEGEQNGMK